MKKLYFFAFILLNLLNSCSESDSGDPEQSQISAGFNLSATVVNIGDDIKVKNNSVSSAEIVSYTFNFGNGTQSNEKEPTFYYSRPGNYDVTLVIKDANGKTSSSTVKVQVKEDYPLLIENQATINTDSDAFPLEIGIHDNKIFYTENYRSILSATGSQFYRHVEYDDATKTFTTKVISQNYIRSGHTKTTFLNNGNKIVTIVESFNYIGGREEELDSNWGPVKSETNNQITYGSIQNNDQYYFYGSYDKNPSIEIRNNNGEFVSRKTFETEITNAFIGDLIKTGNMYIAFGGKYELGT
ncbi:MAG: PKD domain-containing protein, partial [Chryseobacterium sp.]